MTPDSQAAGARAQTPVAVIDIGATAIRMVVAELGEGGVIRPLESVHHAVHLGKDTFTTGRIRRETIQECVGILQGFRQLMQELGVERPDQVRAVATSSVREAQNRDVFLDRVYIATGLEVRAIDEAEESRLTYLAVQGLMESEADLKRGDALVVEVGGGSTDLLLLQGGHVTFAESYRLGALRMRETLETYRAPAGRIRTILGQHIERAVEQILAALPVRQVPFLVAMAGDARFAAAHLCPDWDKVPAARIDLQAFTAFAEQVVPLPVEKLVQQYALPYEEAETLGPALLAYVRLAHAFQAETLIVSKASLRDGLLREMVLRGSWTDAFAREAVHSALALGAKYRVDPKHARHVADLCGQLFRELQPDHRLDARHGVLLELAALLHEVGGFVSSRSHHKHSLYLILNSELFGLTREDMNLIALVARYHRRAHPDLRHPEYALLDRDGRLAVSKLAALLRVADGLDRNHVQHIRNPAFARAGGQFVITVGGVEDLTVERLTLREKAGLFEEIYGLPVVLKEARVGTEELSDA